MADANDDPNAPQGPQPPERPFDAWKPDDGLGQWDVRHAGHLLRRGTFGASRERLDQALEQGMDAAVESIFAFDPQSDVGGLNAFLDQARGLYDIRRGPHLVAEWWFHRMMRTPAPLQERVALFWHDHFATSAAKVGRSDWMHDQIELFRTDGLGSFRDLVVKVGRQPAMLRWLDGHDSHKSDPNENYGREVLELFCLGVGHYTEKDVAELARAFSGWRIDNREGKFSQDRFDDGEKSLFEGTDHATKGTLNDEAAVDAILKHPAASRFIATRLLQAFVHPRPDEAHVEHYAGRLRHHQWNVGQTLKEMLRSRLFHGDWAWRSRIKSPVELAVGSCFATSVEPRAQFLRQSCERMGQKLLYPPNVAGWSGGEVWINANTVMVRFEFFRDLARQGFNEFAGQAMYDFLYSRKLDTPAKVVNAYGDLLLDGQVPGRVRGRLLDYMTRGKDNEPADFKLDDGHIREKVRGMIQLLASAPQYQLA